MINKIKKYLKEQEQKAQSNCIAIDYNLNLAYALQNDIPFLKGEKKYFPQNMFTENTLNYIRYYYKPDKNGTFHLTLNNLKGEVTPTLVEFRVRKQLKKINQNMQNYYYYR